MGIFDHFEDWVDSLRDRFIRDHEDNRREERSIETDGDVVDGGNALEDSPKIVSFDLMAKENALRHNCEQFELVSMNKTCIIRRGGTFSMRVTLNQEADLKNTQLLKLFFNFGSRPNVQKNTQGIVTVTGKVLLDQPHYEWDARVESYDGNTAVLEIQVPEDVPVGIWKVAGQVASADDTTAFNTFRDDDAIMYILFNPWNKEDTVFLEDEELRNEYVLNDVGKIWVGSYPTASGKQWVFGQFDDAVLPACILVMERSGLDFASRGDPVKVSRAISRVVNSNDGDGGVVIGKWETPYTEGTPPLAWTGSIKILEDYLRKSKPVKYGQCWVFSGVTTTICRALGIPCRSVSNLNSAHDTNNSLTIDKYFNKAGEEIKEKTDNTGGVNDSIWNFHVWNDVWMERPDLPSGYGGWQAIDATPQERSNGFYQCGPASLEAVRRGQVWMNYDVGFVMAEVNADLVKWYEDEDEKIGFKRFSDDKKTIGKEVLTKKPGPLSSSTRWYNDPDKKACTTDYKPNEGTRAERITLQAAAARTRAGRQAFRIPSVVDQDCEFEIEDVERVPIGEDFTLTVTIKNTSSEDRNISVVMGAVSEYYTGVKADDIKRNEGKFLVKPGTVDTLRLTFTYEDYYEKLVEFGMMKLVSIANVMETSQSWIGEDKFQVIKPPIEINAATEMTVGTGYYVELGFKNPLKTSLSNCFVTVDGPGISRPRRIHVDNVPAKDGMKYKVKVWPKKSGTRNLVAVFNSTELVDITGSVTINIVE